ncbi:flagellar hook protein FlgE [Anaerovibrio sp.]|uniref:flagellar hook protein FlgE n=1 Tax=Anaerovibrio sp. TaxID=1872532 RepID=UPI003F191929
MMRSLYSGVSGLKNHQNRMDVVGNNISNVNTTGFKSSRVTFSDTLSQTLSGASAPQGNLGGTNPKQIGLGSALSSIDTLFTDGSVQSTGVNTDLCLSGSGLFIVNDGALSYYTRNGNFKFDKDGYYVNSDGLKVQGWMAGKLGEDINTNGQPGEICIPAGKTMEATATTTAKFTKNLNAAEPMIKSMVLTFADGNTKTVDTTDETRVVGMGEDGNATTDPAKLISAITVNMTDGTTTTETSGAYTVGKSKPITTIMTVYDSVGNAHEVTMYMIKTDIDSTDGNTWKVTVNSKLGEEKQEIQEKDGSVTKVSMTDAVLQFDTNGAYKSGSGSATLTLNNGATGTQTVTIDLTGLTQYAGSNTAFASTDGNEAGTLKSVSIDSAGVITGTYTNGLNVQEAQIAIAQFNNMAGLTKNGNSLYTVSNNSGTPNIGTINGLGCTVTPSALEMSNVDMASELTDMIVTQRGYQSNSKIITVSDELLETLINMKR